jgi:hypothetical protein
MNPSPLRHVRGRLWLGGLALLLFIVTAAVGNSFLRADRAVSLRSAGFDFLAFYTGGTFVRTGQSGKLYDLEAVRAFQQEVARENGIELRPGAVGPFWNPPIVGWVFAPLSVMPYRAAFFVWTMFNVACVTGAMAILCHIVASAPRGGIRGGQPPGAASCKGGAPMPHDWPTWGLVPLLTGVSMPLIMSIGHGQNACLSLLILSGAVALWRGERFFAAGAVAGLLFYKPQVGAVVAAVMIVCCGWRALAGLAMTGAMLLVTTLVTLPGTLTAFIQQIPGNLATMQVQQPYAWERHVTLKAFWRLLVQGHATGEMSSLAMTLYIATAFLLAACVAACIWKLRQSNDEFARDRIISITILSMPLLMPFYFDYDLLLLAAPAVLTAREAIARGGIERHVTIAWVALYAWLIVNPHVAAITRVNGTVVLLTTVATMMMARAMRRTVARTAATASEYAPLRRAA